MSPPPAVNLRLNSTTSFGVQHTKKYACSPPPPASNLPAKSPIVLPDGTYHSEGLFPTNTPEQREPIFKAKCVYAKPHFYVSRKVALEEYFLIFDVPEQLSKRVKSSQLRTLKTQLSIPLKTYTSVLYKLCPVPPSHFHHKPRPTPTSLPASLPTKEPSISTDRNEKATKSDDSEIPYHLWRNHLSLLTGVNLTPDWEISANKLRQVLLGRWKRNVTSSFWTFLKKQCLTQPTSRSRSIVDTAVTILPSGRYAWRDKVLYKKWHFTYQSTCYWNPGMECILRASPSSWWVWDQGSRPFFWNFDDEFILDAMYGNKPWIEEHLPRFQARQKPKENGDLAQLVASKFAKVRKLLYVKPTQAKSEIDCFWVPKGDDDLRIVYNGTSYGLNPVYWAPWFGLPTVYSQLRALLPGYSTGDADIGDMFHNFMQHPSVAPFIGINIIKYDFDYVHELKDLNFMLEGVILFRIPQLGLISFSIMVGNVFGDNAWGLDQHLTTAVRPLRE